MIPVVVWVTAAAVVGYLIGESSKKEALKAAEEAARVAAARATEARAEAEGAVTISVVMIFLSITVVAAVTWYIKKGSKASNLHIGSTDSSSQFSWDQDNPEECPICICRYNVTDGELRVRSLGCGHSMCTSCLRQLHQRRSVTCPCCRYVHRAETIDTIPINRGMESLINSRESIATQSS